MKETRKNLMKKITMLMLVGLVFAVVMAAENSAVAIEVYTCISIDEDGGVTDKGRRDFHRHDQVTMVIEAYPLFPAKIKIELIDPDTKRVIRSYLRDMPGGASRQWVRMGMSARGLTPKTYIVRYHFRNNYTRETYFRVVIAH